MTINNALLAAAAAATATSADMNQASKGGGGEYVPPAAGVARLRFIGYVETGLHEDEFDGKPKDTMEVQLTFELSGPNHQPKVLESGEKIPYRMTIYVSASKAGYHAPLNEKAALYKLFKRMNWEGKAKHMVELLGQSFLGTVVHKAGKDGKVRAYLKDDSGYTIQPPRYNDPLTGQTLTIEADPPISQLRVFVWNAQGEALKAMWDSLFIDGSYEAEGDRPARSKNVYQEKIKAAKNFVGSPIWTLLQTGGVEMQLGNDPLAAAADTAKSAAPTPSTTSPYDDPLAGVN